MSSRKRIGKPPSDAATPEGSVRADERRRIARDLHDSTSQVLVAIQLQLGRLRRSSNGPEVAAFIEECQRITDSIHAQIRDLDHNGD